MIHKKTLDSFFYKYLLTLFIFLNCIFYRDFSYISFGDVLFITEILLIISFFALLTRVLISYKIKFNYQIKLWLIFFSYGSLLLIIDNASGIFFKFREFAAIAYSAFFFIILALLSGQKSSNLVFRAILFGSFLSIFYIFYKSIIGQGNITTTEGVIRYGNYEFVGINILFSYFFSKLLSRPNNLFLIVFIVLFCLIAVFVFIAHTSAMLGMLLSTVIILIIHKNNKQAKKINLFLFLLSPFAFIIIFSAFDSSTTLLRFTRIFSLDIFNDPNVSWRLVTWLHALSQMNLKDIFFGVGWGYELPIYTLNDIVYADDGYEGLHNSILFYFFHTGLIGTFLFLSLIFSVYKKAFKVIKLNQGSLDNCKLVGLLAGNIGILFFSLFNVVLEGPYMAIIFWISFGLLTNFGQNVELKVYTSKN